MYVLLTNVTRRLQRRWWSSMDVPGISTGEIFIIIKINTAHDVGVDGWLRRRLEDLPSCKQLLVGGAIPLLREK